MKLRTMLIWAMLAVALGTVNWLALGRERLAANGQVMYLALSSLDLSSPVQGDSMNLRYELANYVPVNERSSSGALVVSLDKQQKATFVRIYQPGSPLAAGEHLLGYRVRSGQVRIGAESFFFQEGQVRIGAESFFFQEGQAAVYQGADFGELRVAPDGTAALVGLRGANLEPLGK
jgi:uncharacterized membrane-anchored protein